MSVLWRVYQADILLFGHAHRQLKHHELYLARIKYHTVATKKTPKPKFIFIKTSEKV